MLTGITVLEEIDVEPQHMWRARDVVVGDEEIVAVGRRLDAGIDPDGAARSAGAVFDEHLLPDAARDMVADQPRDEIQSAAGGQMHDKAHRPVRPVLRAQNVRRKCRRAERCRAFDNFAPSDGHAVLR
jgi:hypothetical protein